MTLIARTVHTDSLKGCTQVRGQIGEHEETTIKSTGQELVELALLWRGHTFALGFLAGPFNLY